MKKILLGSLMASMLIVPAMAQNISVYLNNERMVFDQNPIIENGRTLVPIRSIFEGLGAEVKWNPDIQEIRGITNNKEVVLWVGKTNAIVNGNEVFLDVPVKIINGRTLVPLRFISESLNAGVKWNQEEWRVDIESNTYKELELRYHPAYVTATRIEAERVLSALEAGVGSGKIPLTKSNAVAIGLGDSNKKLLSSITKNNPISITEIIGIDNLYRLPDGDDYIIDILGTDIEREKNYFRVFWEGTEKLGRIHIVNSESAMENVGGKTILYAILEREISNPVYYAN